MKLVIDTPDLRIYEGDAKDWKGGETIDLVFTNPYGPLPKSLFNCAMIIHQWEHRRGEAEEWCGNRLRDVLSAWNDEREVFWRANIAERIPVDLKRYRPEPGGWYPEELVRDVLSLYVSKGQTVWDGFMGRGTVAKVCRDLGVRYVGVEQLPEHIALAKTYLALDGTT